MDYVILHHPVGTTPSGVRAFWSNRGFLVATSDSGPLMIRDHENSGLLRKAFTQLEINRLKRLEGVEIKASWQSIKLADIVKRAKRKLREAGITDTIEVDSYKSSHDGPLVQSKMIIVGGCMVAEISKKGWEFYFRTYGSNARRTMEIRGILRSFLEGAGIREK